MNAPCLPHILWGGARINDDPQSGVVNGFGEVHGHPGLYITDAAVFPQPLGVPPSLSIAAWSSHVSSNIVTSAKSSNLI